MVARGPRGWAGESIMGGDARTEEWAGRVYWEVSRGPRTFSVESIIGGNARNENIFCGEYNGR